MTARARPGARLLAVLALAALTALAGTSHAGVLRVCEPPAEMSAGETSRVLRFAAAVRTELERSGASLALVSRSGLDLGLDRLQVRYSHAGVSLQASDGTPWAVRQLYFACDEQRPLLYDQGLSAFVLGTNAPALGYVSIVLLPPPQAALLEQAALDKRQALQLLGSAYSANAYPFSVRYQNCNQWLAELLAAAFSGLDGSAGAPRQQAQAWLHEHGYVPSVFNVGPLMGLAALVPFVHGDDHPAADRDARIYRVSMPASIEAFVHAALPLARRIELCHTASHIVVHRGWEPVADGCLPAAQDTVTALD